MTATEATSPALLSVDQVTKTFTTRTGFRRTVTEAVAGVSLELHRGQTLGLVGESGSGKSTTARIATKLIAPTSGRVCLDGVDVTDARPSTVRRLGSQVQMVFQDPVSSFDPTTPIGRSVVEPLHGRRLDRAAADAEAARLLEVVGLDPSYRDRYPRQLSGGQLQRAAIARALAPDPQVVVLDEPVSALDLSTQAQVVNLLSDLQRTLGQAYLFVAHDLAVVRHISDRVAVMFRGRIVEEGPSDAIYDSPSHPYTAELIRSVPGRQRVRRDLPTPGSAPVIGCRYAHRCASRFDVCTQIEPVPVQLASGVTVACHLYGDASPTDTTDPRSQEEPS